MKQNKRKIIVLLAICLSILMTGCTPNNSETCVSNSGTEDGELFRIEEESCSLQEARVYLETLRAQYEGVFNSNMWKRDFGGVTLEDYLKETAVSQLAQMKTMGMMAAEKNIELNKKEKKMVAAMADDYLDACTDKEKKCFGLKKETLVSLYEDYMLANKVYQEVTKNVDLEVSDDEARVIKVQCIFIATYVEDLSGNRTECSPHNKQGMLETAQAVHDSAVKGEDFYSLAETYNEGDSIELTFRRGEQPKAVEKVAFDMTKDQISDVIKTDDGYYILKCLNDYVQEKTDANKAVIVQERKSKAFHKQYDACLKTVRSEFEEDMWDNVHFEKDNPKLSADFFEIYNKYTEKEQ